MDKQTQLDLLRREIIDDNVCAELADQAIQLVHGDGNPDADIVFLGEAPGRKEDETGLPFVGASGKLLDELLASISLSRQDVYITSVVQYRPPNNRDPKPSEKAAFRPYLLRQLDIIQPLVIATLGRHSLAEFLPEAKIAEVHGKPQKLSLGGRELIIIPLYHPAAAIYNRKLRQTLFDDFSQLLIG